MIDKRNLLLLSAGRRVGLLEAFRAEVLSRGIQSKILATDSNPLMSPACRMADQAFAVQRATADGYIEQLLVICEQNSVGLVIPTIDTELLRLSQARCLFAERGIHVAISDESLVQCCRDKRQSSHLFASIGVETPRILSRDQLTFPCFAKPYDGSRSIGAVRLDTELDLTSGILQNSTLMFMEYIDNSFDEYTVDAYYDRSGDLKCLVPRHRLEVRDGEISKGVTRKSHVFEYLKEKLAGIRGARGCLTVQLFARPDGQRYVALEINPRFGGGFPLSYAAGANFPGWLIDEYLLGKEIPFFDGWEADLLMLRYDSQLLVSKSLEATE